MKINLLTKEEFFDKLDHGCQIRVTYDKQFHDDCENHGWWSEELWCYDKKRTCIDAIILYHHTRKAFIQSIREIRLKHFMET